MESTIAVYPKIGLRAKTGITSDMIPITGRIMMYTSGCPKNQKTCWKRTAFPPRRQEEVRAGLPVEEQHRQSR